MGQRLQREGHCKAEVAIVGSKWRIHVCVALTRRGGRIFVRPLPASEAIPPWLICFPCYKLTLARGGMGLGDTHGRIRASIAGAKYAERWRQEGRDEKNEKAEIHVRAQGGEVSYRGGCSDAFVGRARQECGVSVVTKSIG